MIFVWFWAILRINFPLVIVGLEAPKAEFSCEWTVFFRGEASRNYTYLHWNGE